MKKKIIVTGVIVVLVIAIVTAIIFTRAPYKASRNIDVSVSSHLVKTDVDDAYGEQSGYYSSYKNYALNDKYEYYSCIVKIVNNSGYDIINASFPNMDKDYYRIDYDNDVYDPFNIPSKSVGYIACIISVKKDISEDEFNKIVDNLPSTITLYSGDRNDVEYDFSIDKEYSVTDYDYSNEDIQYHYYV